MTATECINYIDAIEPNAYTSAQKLGWLSECEGKVYTQLFLVQPYEFIPVTSGSRVLVLPAPYDRIYPRYLQAMIHYANGEYDRYANSMAVFNEAWGELNRWFGGDYDVTDRLRNRRFEAEITPEAGYQEIMEIPQGCAVAGARLIVGTPFSKQYFMYYFLEDINAVTYSFQLGTNWYTMDTTGVTGLENGFAAGDIITSRGGTSINYYPVGGTLSSLSASSGHTGAVDLIDTTQAQLWVDAHDNTVGTPISLLSRGTEAEPMIIADRGGSLLGITLGPGYWLRAGTIKLTGRLLIPDEQWAYEDKYAGRRDARWQS